MRKAKQESCDKFFMKWGIQNFEQLDLHFPKQANLYQRREQYQALWKICQSLWGLFQPLHFKYFTCHGPNTKDCPQENKLKNVKKHAEITDMGPLV